MDNNELHDEIVVDESRKLYNILNFQDFMLEESKKDKKEAKKSKKLIKNREEYIEDMIPLTRMNVQNATSNFANSSYRRTINREGACRKTSPFTILSIFPDLTTFIMRVVYLYPTFYKTF